jgi:hypothetical protein
VVGISIKNLCISLLDRRKFNRYFSTPNSNALSFGTGSIPEFYLHLGTLPCEREEKFSKFSYWDSGAPLLMGLVIGKEFLLGHGRK